jgi:hypothetical protein
MKLQAAALLMFISISSFSQGKFFGGNGDGFAVSSVSNIVLPLRVIDFSVLENGNAVKGKLIIVSNELLCSIYFE